MLLSLLGTAPYGHSRDAFAASQQCRLWPLGQGMVFNCLIAASGQQEIPCGVSCRRERSLCWLMPECQGRFPHLILSPLGSCGPQATIWICDTVRSPVPTVPHSGGRGRGNTGAVALFLLSGTLSTPLFGD